MATTHRIATVIIEDEDIFLDLIQRFPAHRYPLFFVDKLSDARPHLEAQQPLLLVVPTAPATDREQLDSILQRARALETKVIGLISPEAQSPTPDLFDRTIPREDVASILDTVAELLDERRSAARVPVEIPLMVTGLGQLRATIVSGRSLFVPTSEPPTEGSLVEIQIEAGDASLECRATVQRVRTDGAGGPGMVLCISQREIAARSYLDGVVRGALLLERAQATQEDDSLRLPDAVTKRLIERIEQEMAGLRAQVDLQTVITDDLRDRMNDATDVEKKTAICERTNAQLAGKLSAQRKIIDDLVKRVDDLTAKQASAAELRYALRAQSDLQEKVRQQQGLISTLREQLERLDGEVPAPPAKDPAPAPGPADLVSEAGPAADQPTELPPPSQPSSEADDSASSTLLGSMPMGEWAPMPYLEQPLAVSSTPAPAPVLDVAQDDVHMVGQDDVTVVPQDAVAVIVSRKKTYAVLGAAALGMVVIVAGIWHMGSSPAETSAVASPTATAASSARTPVHQEHPGSVRQPPTKPILEASKDPTRDEQPDQATDAQVGRATQEQELRPTDAQTNQAAEKSADQTPEDEAQEPSETQADEPAEEQAQESAAAEEATPKRRVLTPAQHRRIARSRNISFGVRVMRKGHYKASRRYLTRALKLADDDVIRWLLARSHERAGETWPAIYHLTLAAKKAPRKRKAKRYNYLGKLYLKVGKRAQACSSFAQALRYQPGYSAALSNEQKSCKH